MGVECYDDGAAEVGSLVEGFGGSERSLLDPISPESIRESAILYLIQVMQGLRISC